MKTLVKMVVGAVFVGTMLFYGLLPVDAGDCKDNHCGGIESTPTVIITPTATATPNG